MASCGNRNQDSAINQKSPTEDDPIIGTGLNLEETYLWYRESKKTNDTVTNTIKESLQKGISSSLQMKNSTYISYPVKLATVSNCPTLDYFNFMAVDIYLGRKDEILYPDFRLDTNAKEGMCTLCCVAD